MPVNSTCPINLCKEKGEIKCEVYLLPVAV